MAKPTKTTKAAFGKPKGAPGGNPFMKAMSAGSTAAAKTKKAKPPAKGK